MQGERKLKLKPWYVLTAVVSLGHVIIITRACLTEMQNPNILFRGVDTPAADSEERKCETTSRQLQTFVYNDVLQCTSFCLKGKYSTE